MGMYCQRPGIPWRCPLLANFILFNVVYVRAAGDANVDSSENAIASIPRVNVTNGTAHFSWDDNHTSCAAAYAAQNAHLKAVHVENEHLKNMVAAFRAQYGTGTEVAFGDKNNKSNMVASRRAEADYAISGERHEKQPRRRRSSARRAIY